MGRAWTGLLRRGQADDRRFAEAHYKAALALQFRQSPEEALVHARAAVQIFRARIARLARLAAGGNHVGSGGGDPAAARPAGLSEARQGRSSTAAEGGAPGADAEPNSSLMPAADGGASGEAGQGSALLGASEARSEAREGAGAAADRELAAKVRSGPQVGQHCVGTHQMEMKHPRCVGARTVESWSVACRS